MLAIFKNSLNKTRGSILGWGISLALLGAMFIPIYPTIRDAGDLMDQYLELFPPEMLAFFGDISSMSTPAGYLSLEYFSFIPLVLAIFAIGAGSGMIAGDEENGTLDLIAAHPVSRSSLFLGRLFAFLASLLLILVFSYLGLYIPAQLSDMGLTAAELATPFISMFAYLVLFGALSLLLSMLLPSKKVAGMISGIILIADFFIQGFSASYSDLKPLAEALPLNFYQGVGWIDGLENELFLSLLGVAILFSLTAWWRFLRRDIRVGGEGSWQLPRFSFARSKSAENLDAAKVSGD